MVGALRGRSTTRKECTNAMHDPCSVRSTLSEDAQTLVLCVALLCLIMDFIYQVTLQVYIPLVCVSVFEAAAAAPKKALPGSASGAARAKPGDNNSNASLTASNAQLERKCLTAGAQVYNRRICLSR